VLEIGKEAGLEVNSEKAKYMFMFRLKNAGQSRNIKIANKCFDTGEEFKYLGTTATNQNYIYEETRSSYCHSVKRLTFPIPI